MGFSEFERKGYLNRSTEDLGAICMGKKSDYQAYCGSTICSGPNFGPYVKIKVENEPVNCPVCNHALMYKRIKKSLFEANQ